MSGNLPLISFTCNAHRLDSFCLKNETAASTDQRRSHSMYLWVILGILDDFNGKCFQNNLSGFKGYILIALNFLLCIIN